MSKEDNERGFFGIIIPLELLENNELSISEKFIFGYIASFRKACFKSNQGIAEQLNISESSVSHAIPKLEKLGYIFIEKDSRNNNVRRMYSVLENPKKLAYLASKGLWKNLWKSEENLQKRRQNLLSPRQNLPTPQDDLTEKAKAKFADIDIEERKNKVNPEQKPNLENASDFGSLEAKSSANPRPLRKDFSSDEEWEKAFYKWNYA